MTILLAICMVCMSFVFDVIKLIKFTVQIMNKFVWYDDLVTILGVNLAVSLKTILSVPGIDHAANFFELVAGSAHSKNVQPSSSMQYGGYVSDTQPTPPSTQPAPPSAQPAPPGAQYGGY